MREGYSRIGDWFRRMGSEESRSAESAEATQPSAQTRASVKGLLSSGIEGVVTDQKLLSWYYRQFEKRDTQPVTTDKFMDKSKNEYNSAWLARELIQNFVDENEEHPYTLDGVEITSEMIDEKTGKTRFTIRGNWKFEDPTGLTSFHSAKTKKRKTAGGNGIGLKQVALRYLRDFGVEKFQIEGEGWSVNYRLAKKDEINQRLEEGGRSEQLRHDWLVADIQHSGNRGSNKYIIETNNAELIQALQELPNLSVSETNTFLQNPDFKNKKGALKWMPIADEGIDAQGRLYINGQVMNFKSKGETANDYWRGPELVTIQLNDIDYKMSIDRPPISVEDLKKYIADLIQSMSVDELLDQLKKSEHIWGEVFDSLFKLNRKGCSVIIAAIVRKLSFSTKYDKKSFETHFGGKKYLFWDAKVNEGQIRGLEKQGFIICPSYFGQIGMQKASTKLDSLEVASNEKPTLPTYELEQIAEKYGLAVAHERIEVKDPEQFLRSIKERLSVHAVKIDALEERPNTFRIYLNSDFPKNLLFHRLHLPKTEQQKLLHYLRSVVFVGLKDKIFEQVFTSSGEYVTTFNTEYDFVTTEYQLLARNIKCSSDQGAFIEFELPQKLAISFKDSLVNDSLAKIEEKNLEEEKNPEIDDTQKAKPENKPQAAGSVEQQPAKTLKTEILVGKNELKAVPIDQPKAPALPKQKIIVKQTDLSPEEQIQLTKIEEKIPEITKAIAALESVAPTKMVKTDKEGVVGKYVLWRRSGDFYGQATMEAQYLSGRHLMEIVAESNQADIAIAVSDRKKTETERKMAHLNATLKNLANRFAPREDKVDDFEIVLAPTERQLAKLGILRTYSHLTTSVVLPNDLFIYKGTGSYGVNIAQKAIGLHEALLQTDFKEALGTFTHEIAHNASMGHGPKFMSTMEALFTTTNDELTRISEKLLNEEPLTEEELMVLELKRNWDELG